MLHPTLTSFTTNFSSLTDPRIEGKIRHKLIDIIVITISQ